MVGSSTLGGSRLTPRGQPPGEGLLPAPWTRRPRRRVPCGRALTVVLGHWAEPQNRVATAWGNDGTAGGRQQSNPALVAGGPAARLRTCFKGSASIRQVAPRKQLSPPRPVRGSSRWNPLGGQGQMLWFHRHVVAALARASGPRPGGGDGARPQGFGLGQVASVLRRCTGLCCDGRWGEKGKWPAASVAGPGGDRGRASGHTWRRAPLPSSLGGLSDSSCRAGAGGARCAESAGPKCGGYASSEPRPLPAPSRSFGVRRGQSALGSVGVAVGCPPLPAHPCLLPAGSPPRRC